MDIAVLKYKDEFPINTINRIRNILSGLGLLTVETVWKNSVDGYYSVSITIEGTNIFTNGKGVTREFALASAYGEMMERLQNQAVFRLSLDLRPEVLEAEGFFYAPDEKQMTMDEFIHEDNEWLRCQLNRLNSQVSLEELLRQWQAVSYEAIPNDFIALPYLNLSSRKISYIPIKMSSKMYMSNGMCAGNTFAEAVVQGISEILERYVNKRIITEKIVPPDVPFEYLRQYPKIVQMISAIEARGNFKIIIKDCTLQRGLPVVGIIFINKDDQTYFVKFGSHPLFEVAAERTLTELLQGQDIRSMMGVREFLYKHHAADDPNNIMGIMVNGSGVYPKEFFSSNYSYTFCEFPQVRAQNNKELLEYLTDLLWQLGHEIYVRDVSYLGFPSYHIIVPGVSEIEEFAGIREITEYTAYNKLKRIVRQLDKLDQNEAAELIQLLNSMNYDPEASVMDLINLPVRSSGFPWYYSKIDLFLTALYCRRNDFINAYTIFDKFLKFNQKTVNRAVLVYYKCVRDYLGARIDGLQEQEIYNMLTSFYSPDVVRGVLKEFGNTEQITCYLGQLSCWACGSCRFQSNCMYNLSEHVYKVLKERYAASAIEQANMLL